MLYQLFIVAGILVIVLGQWTKQEPVRRTEKGSLVDSDGHTVDNRFSILMAYVVGPILVGIGALGWMAVAGVHGH